MFGETPIILGVDSAEIDPKIPQTTGDARFMRIHTHVVGGELDVRVSVGAAPRLAEAIMAHTLATEVDATDFYAELDKTTGIAKLTPVSRHATLSIFLPRDVLEKLRNQLSRLLDD